MIASGRGSCNFSSCEKTAAPTHPSASPIAADTGVRDRRARRWINDAVPERRVVAAKIS